VGYFFLPWMIDFLITIQYFLNLFINYALK